MIIQIYSVTRPGDAKKLCELGVDNIGLVVGEKQELHIVTPGTAREIFSVVLPGHKKVALSRSSNAEELLRICDKVSPDILHLATADPDFSSESTQIIKARFPNIELMKSIYVLDGNTVKDALFWQDHVEYLLLDTATGKHPTGGTGKINNWEVGKVIVDTVRIPVILAGGLGPHNIAKAIDKVKPYGVDSMTHTNKEGSILKDFKKVGEFVRIAKSF